MNIGTYWVLWVLTAAPPSWGSARDRCWQLGQRTRPRCWTSRVSPRWAGPGSPRRRTSWALRHASASLLCTSQQAARGSGAGAAADSPPSTERPTRRELCRSITLSSLRAYGQSQRLPFLDTGKKCTGPFPLRMLTQSIYRPSLIMYRKHNYRGRIYLKKKEILITVSLVYHINRINE